jgi:TetR/AcrR family transcriptional regulator, upper aerobic nicotinate degradation pathway regulator
MTGGIAASAAIGVHQAARARFGRLRQENRVTETVLCRLSDESCCNRTAATMAQRPPPQASGKGRKTQPRSTEVAEAMRAAALDLFSQQNYSTVTIKDIATATGSNSALIYYHFGSKEELFLKVVTTTVDEAFRKFEDVRANAKSPEEVIFLWIEIHIVQFVLLQKLAKISLDYASTRNRTSSADRAIRRFYDKESVVLGEAISAGIEQGVFRPVDPQRMSIFISTFLDGCLFRNVMFPRFSYRRAMQDMRTFVIDHLRATPAPPAGPIAGEPGPTKKPGRAPRRPSAMETKS